MITISRAFTVAAPAAAALSCLKDFGTTGDWDPATRRTTRTDTGPLAPGAHWHHVSKVLGVTTELTYTLLSVTADRLVFAGRNEGATTTNTITVRPAGGGSEVTYRLELELHGLAKLATPVLRPELEKLGTGAAVRLSRVLDRLTTTV